MRRPPILLIALALTAAPAAGQGHDVETPTPTTPHWLHISPHAGAVAVSRPGRSGRLMAGIQLEVSHVLPMGMGFALGYWTGDDSVEGPGPHGPSAEALFSYRFHLRGAGRVAPYAGPIAGVLSDDVGPARELRWYFGGRGGVDFPIPGAWPAVRLEASYRHVSERGDAGAAETVVVMLGGRWSIPVER